LISNCERGATTKTMSHKLVLYKQKFTDLYINKTVNKNLYKKLDCFKTRGTGTPALLPQPPTPPPDSSLKKKANFPLIRV